MKLMKHQRDLLDRLEAEGESLYGKVLYGGVGSGKSITVLSYYLERDMGMDIYVITTAKKRDKLEWEGDAAKLGIGTSRGATLAGTITVDSWHNIHKYTDVEDAFFILDEQRLVGSGLWVKSFQKIAKKNAWCILSATPGDTWMDYIPVFIANGYYKNKTEFCNRHVIWRPFTPYPQVMGYRDEGRLEELKREVLVEMPYMSVSDRIHQDVRVFYDVEKLDEIAKKRWNIFENSPIKHAAEMWACARRLVYTHPSRLMSLVGLMAKHPKIIVFYNFNYELDILRTLHDSHPDVEVAEWNGHRKEEIPKSKRWVYLVQYTAGAEGWNCTETDAMVFYSLPYSYKKWEQSQGRIDRLNSPFSKLFYYSFMSNSFVDRAVKISLGKKESFNENNWADEFMPVFDELDADYDRI